MRFESSRCLHRKIKLTRIHANKSKSPQESLIIYCSNAGGNEPLYSNFPVPLALAPQFEGQSRAVRSKLCSSQQV